MSAKWVDISKEQAKAHPLYGCKGWLGAFVVLTGGLNILNMTRSGYELLSREVAVFDVAAAIGAMELGLGVYVFVVLAKLFQLDKDAVKYTYVLLAMLPGSAFAGAVISSHMLAPELQEFVPRIWFPVILRNMVAAGAWWIYFHESKRVNVTFLHRVRSNDPTLEPESKRRTKRKRR